MRAADSFLRTDRCSLRELFFRARLTPGSASLHPGLYAVAVYDGYESEIDAVAAWFRTIR